MDHNFTEKMGIVFILISLFVFSLMIFGLSLPFLSFLTLGIGVSHIIYSWVKKAEEQRERIIKILTDLTELNSKNESKSELKNESKNI